MFTSRSEPTWEEEQWSAIATAYPSVVVTIAEGRGSWVKPGPKAHAYLLFSFALARANAHMLINADRRHRSWDPRKMPLNLHRVLALDARQHCIIMMLLGAHVGQ